MIALSPVRLQPEERRRQAESRVMHEDRSAPEGGERTPVATAQLLHELRVHQIELEMQNEELRKAEASLDKAWARYFDLYDLAPMCYLILDDQGIIMEANLTSATLLGMVRGALVRLPITRFILKEDQDLWYILKHRPVQSGEIRECELRMQRKDGTVFWGHLTTVDAQEVEGTPAWRLVISDLSERKRAEEALAEASRFNLQIIDCVQEGVIVYGLDLRYRVWNPFMESISGYPASQVIGRQPGTLFPFLTGTGVLENLEKVLEGKSVEPIDFAYDYPLSGKSGWVTHTTAPLLNARGEITGVIALVREISDRLHHERMLLQTSKMESLGCLAGGVAHDMNKVLGAILSLAMANQELQPVTSKAHQAFDIIAQAAVRGGAMVKRLLSFARTSPLDIQEVDLNSLLREEVSLLEHTTLSKVTLETALAEDLWPIRGDPSALSNAMMNLCVNAVDAMAGNGVLTLRTRNVNRGWIEVVVKDTGAGMPQAVLEKAMDPYFTTKEVGKGTGLGLPMVYSTVRAHGGTMEIHSKPGVGTRVRMRFPTCAKGLEAPPSRDPTLAAATLTPSRRVLLVDDDELIRSSIGAVLEILGHTFKAFPNGEEALTAIRAGFRPELILLDMNMPGLGAVGTLPLVRVLLPDIPVLLCTGRTDQAALELIMAYPGVTLLSKPFSLHELQYHLEHLA